MLLITELLTGELFYLFVIFLELGHSVHPFFFYTLNTLFNTNAMAADPPTKKQCMGADCENDAGALQCPTCLKLGVKDSFFCSQECFKRNWVSGLIDMRQRTRLTTSQGIHKTMHKSQSNLLHHLKAPKAISPDPATGYYNPFPNFPYSGSLRPVYPLSPHRTLPQSIPHPVWWQDGNPRYSRSITNRNKMEILDKAGQDAMRKSCRLAREVLDIAAAAAKPGVTTDYIDEIVHKACIERNVRIADYSTNRLDYWSRRVITDYKTVIPLAFELQQLSQVVLYIR